jgi:hypothetical protein
MCTEGKGTISAATSDVLRKCLLGAVCFEGLLVAHLEESPPVLTAQLSCAPVLVKAAR